MQKIKNLCRFGFFGFFGFAFVLLHFRILLIVFLKDPLKRNVWSLWSSKRLNFTRFEGSGDQYSLFLYCLGGLWSAKSLISVWFGASGAPKGLFLEGLSALGNNIRYLCNV